ncbi:MAG: ATPase [Lachnospiraceae bacterium]|nr:ATPase [Lachnospiraceae bacterium]
MSLGTLQSSEISIEAYEALRPEEYLLVDIREASATDYGMLPGAVHMPAATMSWESAELPKDKKVILYCEKGIISKEIAENLQEKGYDAYSLEGGYVDWLLKKIHREEEAEKKALEESTVSGDGKKPVTRQKAIEKSITHKFHKEIYARFTKAVKIYELVKPGDKIAVCISGGKDSMLMAKLFQALHQYPEVPFDLEFLVMDPGYSKANREIIEQNAKLMGIPIHIFESDIFDAVYTVDKNPCYLCARMRRGHLYSYAKELGCNKIALGHHYDDVIETILMGMLYGAQCQTMMPKLHSTNFEGMELIRPMYLIREDDIKRWRDYNDLHFIQCACHFTDTCTTCAQDGRTVSKRMEIKNLIAEMKKVNPSVEFNIFKSVENVNLNTVIAYKDKEGKHHFLDHYDDVRE